MNPTVYVRLGQIFWGLVLVILDVRFDGFDVLPDFLGYVTVAIGARGLIEISDQFRTAGTLSGVLAILSIAAFFRPPETLPILELLNTVLDCTLIWFLLGGLMDVSLAKGRLDLAELAHRRRIAYLTLSGIVVLYGIFARGSHSYGDLSALMLLPVVIMLILVAMILHLIHRVRNEV